MTRATVYTERLAVLLTLALLGTPWAAAGEESAGGAQRFSAEERSFWAFQPLRDVEPPPVSPGAASDSGRVRTPIDRFILAALEAAGLEPSPPADRRTLIRRLYFDLLGLPPSPASVAAFVSDPRPDAFERLVDRLLASPRYGERWGRHWLDLVRYADSDGFRADGYRPHAWKYRDYVVRSFNDDKPYARFVTEQVAGDETFPGDVDALVATGFLRHWPYEWNQRDVHRQWSDILNDITDVTAEVFLGLSLRCARCHDHKFDPLLQEDYFKLQAFFAPILPDDDLVAATPQEKAKHDRRLQAWLDATAEIRAEMDRVAKPVQDRLVQGAVDKFTPELQELLATPAEQLSPYDRQIQYLANLQLVVERKKIPGALDGEAKKRWEELSDDLERFAALKPQPLAPVLAVTNVRAGVPKTYIPGERDDGEIHPGYPAILERGGSPTDCGELASGRRAELARWLTRADNQLAMRVVVNRIWQYHFGEGLVSTANDFGQQGELPTHPDLLDWLAGEFARRGGSFKAMHRLIVTSSTYRQASVHGARTRARDVDPTNRLLWGMLDRRLSAEEIRDAMLHVSGELDLRLGGPGVDERAPRRSCYLKVLRNNPAALMDAFDAPDGFNSCAERNVTTTPPQALLLLNGDWTLRRATAFAARLRQEGLRDAFGDDCHEVSTAGPVGRRTLALRAFRIALGRPPDAAELEASIAFLDRAAAKDGESAALVDFCHVLLNANEFLYVD